MDIPIQKCINSAYIHYLQYSDKLYRQFITYFPRFDNYNHFEKFVILNLLIIALYLILTLLGSISLKSIYLKIVEFVFSLPFVRKKVEQDLQKARTQILNTFPKECLPTLKDIPYKKPQINIGEASEKQSLKGKLSGSRYAVESHCKFVSGLAKLFSYANPLHLETYPLVKQMENEVIDMTANIINLKDEKDQPCGVLTSGGTESIMMAILAYRQYKFRVDGIKKPNLVICQTGHVAAYKACDYLGIQLRVVKFDKNYEMDFSDMKRNIDSNTICVYSSYPNYPYGTCDPIDIIAKYCSKKGVPVHVDMCLGGFVSPFIQQNWKVPKGVTSISADPHKYGLSAKGVSVLLYSSEDIRKYQFFVCCYWPGGLYGTSGLAGSRSGLHIASAWISMMKLGMKGYRQNAKILRETTMTLADSLQSLGFKIFGNPKVCIISFIHENYSISGIQSFMKKRGWGLSLLQKPLALHFSFTPLNCQNKLLFLKDIKECIEELKKNPITKDTSEIELYGVCAKIPDNHTKRDILGQVLDTFIDLQ